MARKNLWIVAIIVFMTLVTLLITVIYNNGVIQEPNFGFLTQPAAKENKRVSQQFSKIRNETKNDYNWYRPSWYDLSAEEMSPEESIDYFLWSNHTSCELMNDYGGRFMGPYKSKPGVEPFHLIPRGYDGQKSVCLLPDSIAPQSGSCLVYSFGINYDWSFDEVMEEYGCEVYSFDPSMEDMKDKFDHSSNIHFYKIGLGTENTTNDKGWKMLDFESVREMLDHKHRIVDYLKIDVDYAEWEILPQLMKSRALDFVKQLSVEVGFLVPLSTSWKTYQDMVAILRKMERDYGMVRFDSKRNPFYANHFPFVNKYTSLAYEIAWYNSKFLT